MCRLILLKIQCNARLTQIARREVRLLLEWIDVPEMDLRAILDITFVGRLHRLLICTCVPMAELFGHTDTF